MKSQRQTGRTTRMIKEALSLEKQGRAVYIAAANMLHVEDIQTRIPKGSSIKLLTPLTPGWDWVQMSVRGMHPNCVVLIDHAVIELWFGKLLMELHRYDEERSGEE